MSKNWKDNLRSQYGRKKAETPFISVLDIGHDGVDHINTTREAQTRLGKLLSMEYCVRFKHPILGKFACMTALWNYVKSEDLNDEIRSMYGRELTNYSRKLRTRPNVPNFYAIILDSTWHKIKQHPEIIELLKRPENQLPFDYHYFDSKMNRPTRPPYFRFLVEGFEEIRKAVIEGIEPDFTKWNNGLTTKEIYSEFIWEKVGEDNVQESETSLADSMPDETTDDTVVSQEQIVPPSINDEISALLDRVDDFNIAETDASN